MKTIREIKQSVKFTDLLNNLNIKYRSTGTSIQINCISHKDRTPSLSINTKTGVYFCHGCGIKGDIISFLGYVFPAMSFKNRLKYLNNLSNNSNIIFTNKYEEEEKPIIKNKLYYEILDYICNYYQEQLSTEIKNKYLLGKDLIKYNTYNGITEMNGYGFKNSSIIKYRIGYSPNNKKLYNLIVEKYGEDKLIEFYIGNKLLGLFSSNGMPLFKNRIVFPILAGNKIESMIARQTEYTPIDKFNTCKYTVMIGNKNYIYNEYDLIKSPLFITEGITDCISLKEHGYNAVALITTSLNKSIEKRILKEIESSNIYILFDTEKNKSGEKGAIKLSNLLNQNGINNTIITLPIEPGETKVDINKYFIKHTKKDFMQLLGNQLT